MVLGAVLNVFGWVHIEPPPVVLLASFALIGWNIGLRFTHDVLAAAARPPVSGGHRAADGLLRHTGRDADGTLPR
jgi:uncharacterized membrane protein AbrB (regulator of aidB expression)